MTYLKKYLTILYSAGIIILFYFINNYNYLLFHSFIEVFSIIIIASVFTLAINTKQYHENNYLKILGAVFVYVAIFNLMHTLAYRGMTVFQNSDTNMASQFWIISRFLAITYYLS